MSAPGNKGSDTELQFFRQLWENSIDPFWLCEVVGDDYVLVSVNPAERALDPRLEPGARLSDFLSTLADAEHLIEGYHTCRDKGLPQACEQRITLNGVPSLFQTLLVPVLDDNGRVRISGVPRATRPTS